MSTTFYSPTYTVNPSGSNPMKIRAKCVYDTSTSNTSVTISGTIALQHTGGTVSLTSTEAAKVGIYGLSTAPTSSTSTYIDGVYYSGNCSPYKKTSDIVKNSISAHSSWTDLTSTSFSFSVTRGTSAKTSYLFAGLHFSVQEMPGFITSAAYKSISIPALTSYNVTYNANGGSGAPATQKKYYGQTLTLSSTKPTRTNYVFKNWNTASGGTGTTYNPGASYTANAALTLYAQWYAPYTVTYNANGGSGAPANQTKVYNTNLTLSTTRPTRNGFAFLGWSTSSSATSPNANYDPGDTYSTNANLTLYAVWDATPSITSLSAVRCDSQGADSDEGAYARIECVWKVDNAFGDTGAITGTITPQGGSATSFTFGTNPTGSGTVSSVAIVGSGNGIALDTDTQYTVSVTVRNASSGSTQTASRNVILTRAFFIMDFKAGGTGLGIGRAAPASGLEIGFRTTFDERVDFISANGVYMSGNVVIDGITENRYLYVDSATIGIDDTPSAQLYASTLICRDKTDNVIGHDEWFQSTSKEIGHQFANVRQKINGTWTWCQNSFKVSQTGDVAYSIYSPAAFRNAISAVYRGGDTLTGHVVLKDATIDRDGSNPSSALWSRAFQLADKNGERIANYMSSRETDGRTRVGVWAYNEKTDGTEISNSISLYIARNGTCTYAVSSPANFRSAIGALGKVPPSAELPHSTATSNVFPLVLGNTFANNGAISYQNPSELRSTISAAAKTWTQIATTSGTTAKSFTSVASYSEVLVFCAYSTSYVGSVIVPIAGVASTEREYYLTGGRTYGGGRRACCKLSLTKITPYQVAVDDSGYNGNWYVYAR